MCLHAKAFKEASESTTDHLHSHKDVHVLWAQTIPDSFNLRHGEYFLHQNSDEGFKTEQWVGGRVGVHGSHERGSHERLECILQRSVEWRWGAGGAAGGVRALNDN